MTTYLCYIIDDEPLAIEVIEQYLSRIPQFKLCGKATDPLEAHSALKSLSPDLIFLDIEMPDISGLDLIGSMHTDAEVIITTAYREYAVEGFEINALDYLVKPIPFKRFVKAIDRFLEKKLRPLSDDKQSGPTCIFVRSERKNIKIDIHDILYLQGVKDYVKIVTRTQKIMTKSSIGNFLPQLPPQQFIRIHKSYIVSKSKITAYSAQDVEIGDLEIPIGRGYKEAFLKEIQS